MFGSYSKLRIEYDGLSVLIRNTGCACADVQTFLSGEYFVVALRVGLYTDKGHSRDNS